jgi:hypothetical protein
MNAPRRPSVLSVDPGSPGAAVCLAADGSLIEAIAWKATKRGYRLQGYTPAITRAPFWTAGHAQRISEIGAFLAGRIGPVYPSSVRLVCEGVFVHRGHKNPQTAIKLAHFSGRILAHCEDLTGQDAASVLASEWRAAVLGLKRNTRREQAKAASLRYLPAMVPGLADALNHLGELDHITDAAGIALWRQRQGASV